MLYTEGKNPSDWLKHQALDNYSREQIVVLAGSGAVRSLTSGMVLGRALTAAATPAAAAGNAGGTGTIGAVTVGAAALAGVYTVVCIEPASNAGKFIVEDPNGVVVGVATVAVAFSGGGLGFTIADGATDFISGESFTITVAVGSGKYTQIDFAATDGREDAAGILFIDAEAPDGADGKGVAIVRQAICSASQLTWPAGASAPQKAAAIVQLQSLGIVFREGF